MFRRGRRTCAPANPSEIAHGVVDSLLARRYGRCGADRVADAFLSYSRLDGTFVRRLASALEERGKTVWVDVDGIRDGEVFPEALRRAIESSDAFVFVIAPDSVQSSFCAEEVEHAATLNKRIVPLSLRPVPDERVARRGAVSQLDSGGRGWGFEQDGRAPGRGAQHRPRLGAPALAVDGQGA